MTREASADAASRASDARQSSENIAFLGLGLMGAPMAARLLSAGREVRVWNRTVEKAEPLRRLGAEVCASALAAAAASDIVIVMLGDADAVEEVLLNPHMLASLRAGSIVIDMSSISPDRARAHWRALREIGVAHLDAPVSGGTRGAADGKLAIMVGGESADFEFARPVLELMGSPTLVGISGAGQLSKLANQAIVGVTIGIVAEALMLAARGGADPAKVRQALMGGFADSPILRQHGERMLKQAWKPGAPMRIQVKDLRTILAAADALHLSLPLTQRVSEMYESCLTAGWHELDHSALWLELERLNSSSAAR